MKRVPLERLRDMAKQRSIRRGGHWFPAPPTDGGRRPDDEKAANGDE